MRFLLVFEWWRSSIIDPILFTFVFSAIYTLKSMLNNTFSFLFSILLLISAAFELLWWLLGDGLTKSKSLLPWHFTRQCTRFESFDSSILMSTPHSDVNFHQSPPQVEMGQSIPPIAKKSTTKRGQRGINFTVDEDIKLVSAWLNVSLDAVTSTN